MSGAKPMQIEQKSSAVSIILLFLLSSLSLFLTAPSASAASGTDLAVVGSIEPVDGRWYTSYEQMAFTISVENMRSVTTGSTRQSNWYVCTGDVTIIDCTSNPLDQGTFLLANIAGNGMGNFTSLDFWNPSGADGQFTVVYAFSINDDISSNDQLKFHIYLSSTFSDV
jgi:hypothetical protein